MQRGVWRSLEQLGNDLTTADSDAIDPKWDRLVAASLSTAANVIADADLAAMKDGVNRTHRLAGILTRHHGADRTSASYLAGRLSAVADVLGYASEQCADADFVPTISAAKFSPLLRQLADGARTNAHLAKAIGQSEENVCRLLGELRKVGAVLSHRRGRQMYNDLSPAAKAWMKQASAMEEPMPTPVKKEVSEPVRMLPRLSAVA